MRADLSRLEKLYFRLEAQYACLAWVFERIAAAEGAVFEILWALVVVAAIIAASLPAFGGLVAVLPVLCHTTWHLYRRAVAPVGATSARPR